ncbi:phenylcoumaran benzylic ether reductase TP7-like [Eucalyptus grandis]|uniref:phenylcoumaran benzylic ether reductase TP7-like n=1 Tax=Eucalyptus grandis TaxID=71139 RepID=UPI00192EE02D|nr:phenylcoumaran benzylic ether reductase TP7-like [Eucalyptus grandis]
MAEKSKMMVIGGTRYIGKFVMKVSAKSGHPTFALMRESALSDPTKACIIEDFKSSNINIFQVSSYSHAVVFVRHMIVAAIKAAGNIKRFLPSEFRNDVDRVYSVEPAKAILAFKGKIRRIVDVKGIPHTYVCCNSFAGYILLTLAQLGATTPPRDKVFISGDEM